MNKTSWLVPAVIFAATAAALAIWLGRIDAPRPIDDQSQAAEARPARRDFSLVDGAGQRVSLATYEGRWLLIFFGFTNCPDVCPTTMINIAATLDAMGERAEAIQPLFITVDPERDTAALLAEYLANFGGHVVGLSGTPEEIAAAAKGYGVYYAKADTGDGNYAINHTTAVYLVSPAGAYQRPYKPDLDPQEFAKELISRMNAEGQTP